MAASPPTSRPDPSAAVMRMALEVGATPVAHVDIGTMLSGVCSALPPAVGVAAAALVLAEPADPRDPQGRRVFASDDTANRLGLIQHRAERGPVPAAMRGDRPLVVPDLTVSGPPELAAAAADCGLVRSLVMPLPASGRALGGLQLLAGADTTLDERSASMLWPLVSALAARLADARELARVSALVVEDAVDDSVADPRSTPETVAVPVVAEADPTDGEAVDNDPVTDLFAAGDTPDETPPTGQVQLGREVPEHPPEPAAPPTRAFPARVPVLGRSPRPVPRPVPAAVPEQRSGPIPAPVTVAPTAEPTVPAPVAAAPAPEEGGTDSPTRRVPRHRLRDDA